MEYTVQKLAKLAGVSARTLRYYDQIGLLQPARISSSGYRIYGPEQVDALQQILFYRELEVPLERIGELLRKPEYDRLDALRGHREALLEKRARIDRLIDNVQRSITAQERGMDMQDQDKFQGFKQELVAQNEEKYGAEVRSAYGDGAVDAANRKLMGLSEAQYDQMKALEMEVLRLLDEAFATGDPRGEAARKAVEAHKEWLMFTWSEYTAAAHRGLGDMYAGDERFAAYYDRGVPGKAAFLRDAIHGAVAEA